jgi:hypothetical protein
MHFFDESGYVFKRVQNLLAFVCELYSDLEVCSVSIVREEAVQHLRRIRT